MKVLDVVLRKNQEKDFKLSCGHTVCNMNPDAASGFLDYGCPCPLHEPQAWKEAYENKRLLGVKPENWAGLLSAPANARPRVELPGVRVSQEAMQEQAQAQGQGQKGK